MKLLSKTFMALRITYSAYVLNVLQFRQELENKSTVCQYMSKRMQKTAEVLIGSFYCKI